MKGHRLICIRCCCPSPALFTASWELIVFECDHGICCILLQLEFTVSGRICLIPCRMQWVYTSRFLQVILRIDGSVGMILLFVRELSTVFGVTSLHFYVWRLVFLLTDWYWKFQLILACMLSLTDLAFLPEMDSSEAVL